MTCHSSPGQDTFASEPQARLPSSTERRLQTEAQEPRAGLGRLHQWLPERLPEALG